MTNLVSLIGPLHSGSKPRASADAELVFTKGSVLIFLALAVFSSAHPSMHPSCCSRWQMSASSKLTHCPPLHLFSLSATPKGMPLMLFSPVFSQSYPGQMSPGAQASKMFPVSPYGPGAYPGSFVEGGQVAPYDYYGAYGTAGSAPVTDLMTAPGPIFMSGLKGPSRASLALDLDMGTDA